MTWNDLTSRGKTIEVQGEGGQYCECLLLSSNPIKRLTVYDAHWLM